MDFLKLATMFMFVLGVVLSSKVKLLERCSSSEDCPRDSSCRDRGCDAKICLCDDGLMPSQGDNATCVKISEIGEACDHSRRCRGLYSRCNDTNRCVCSPGHTQIKVMDIYHCKQNPVFETEPLLLGQRCDSRKSFCSDSFETTECMDGVCQCISGYRPANLTEVNLYPFRLLQCVPQTFTIDQPFPSSLCIYAQQSTKNAQSSSKINLETSSDFTTVPTTSVARQPNSSTTVSRSSFHSAWNLIHSSSEVLHSFASSSQFPVTSYLISHTSLSYLTSSISTYSYLEWKPTSTMTLAASSSPVESTRTSVMPSSDIMATSFMSSQQIDYSTIGSIIYTSEIKESSYVLMSSQEKVDSSVEMSQFIQTTKFGSSSISERDLMSSLSQSSTHIMMFSSFKSSKSTKVLSMLTSKDISTAVVSSTATEHQSTINYLPSFSAKESSLTIVSSINVEPYQTNKYSKDPFSTIIPHSSKMMSSVSKPTSSSVDTQTTTSKTISTTPVSTFTTEKVTKPTSIKLSPQPSTTRMGEKTTPRITFTTEKVTKPPSIKTSSHPSTTKVTEKTTKSPIMIVSDGSVCNAIHTCPVYGVCEEDRCGSNRCRCQIGYRPNVKRTSYVPLKKLGQKCSSTLSCLGPFTVCKHHVCTCKDDYVRSSDGSWCTHKTSWFIKFPLLGEKCMSFLAECFHDTEQTCDKGTCRCKEGLREAVDADRNVTSSQFFQCRNVSSAIGYREPRQCSDDVEDWEDDPYYRNAISRIRQMQGIIFGVIAGVIVAVTSIICGICYCRYQNRHVVKDMTSDNGSVVSFDRQSSGKYSFRLPRPFVPYLKDYDADHLTYANTAFSSGGSDVPKDDSNSEHALNDRTLRSHKSITLPDHDTEGYNRPNDRNRSISTSSTVDAELSDIELHSTGYSPASISKTFQTNNQTIDPENVEV